MPLTPNHSNQQKPTKLRYHTLFLPFKVCLAIFKKIKASIFKKFINKIKNKNIEDGYVLCLNCYNKIKVWEKCGCRSLN